MSVQGGIPASSAGEPALIASSRPAKQSSVSKVKVKPVIGRIGSTDMLGCY